MWKYLEQSSRSLIAMPCSFPTGGGETQEHEQVSHCPDPDRVPYQYKSRAIPLDQPDWSAITTDIVTNTAITKNR
jgi:hypothetical protein